MPTTKPYQTLHEKVLSRPGANERLAELREATNSEIGLFELRQALSRTQVQLADALGVTQARISQLEHGQDLKVSTLREYAIGLGGRLKIAIEFEDSDGRTSVAVEV